MTFMEQYIVFIKAVTVLLAATSWGTVALLWYIGDRRYDYALWIRLSWSLHAAAFFTGVVVARYFFGYVGPSLAVTSWTHALFLHGIIATAGAQVVGAYVGRGASGYSVD